MTEGGPTNLDDVLARCKAAPFELHVYYPGGEAALRAAGRSGMANGVYRWKQASVSPGEDWIRGHKFREIWLKAPPPGTAEEQHDPDLINWYERGQSFATVIRVAEQHGKAVQIGFEGGQSALRRATAAELHSREWKWDWVENPRGRKDPHNWIPGDEYLRILSESGVRRES